MHGTHIRAGSFAAIALFCSAFVIACSGATITPPQPHTAPPAHGGGAKIGRGARFVAGLPPLSPDTPYTLPWYAHAASHRALRSAATSLAALSDHWFFLVNGYQLATPIPGRPGSAPVPATTPFVLAVNGALANGAPGPNGGISAGIVPMGTTNASALWKVVPVVPGSTSLSQPVFLRSEQSFLPLQPSVSESPVPNVKPSAGLYPSLLTGWAASAVDLDLGNVPNWNTGIYLNQNVYPLAGGAGATTFQQWSYSAGSATINNGEGGSLTMSCAMPVPGQSCISTQSPGGSNSRWYAYPNYELSLVLAEPTPGPAFPLPSVTTAPGGTGVTDVNGEQAAYYYISSKALGSPIASLPRCTIPEQTGPSGNTYYGIRCIYVNVNDVSSTSTCASVAAAQSAPAGAQPFNPGNASQTTTISAADWTVVSTQMNSECSYAGGVMGTFATYNTILNFIFSGSSSQIGSIAAQINATEKVSFAPADILEGIVYTVLNTVTFKQFGIGGLLGNLMQTTVDVSQAKKTNLASPITATAATMYNQLDTAITNDQSTLDAMETGIVWNWNRLRKIGPLTFDDGPNGLGISTVNNDVPEMEQAGLSAYETVFLQIFYPQAYGLTLNPGQTSASISHVGSYDIGSYSTFGSAKGSVNVGVVCQLNDNPDKWFKICPSASLMAAPTPLPQQSRFALFNGLNGWSGMPRMSSTFGGNGAMVNIFNGSPAALSVKIVPQNHAVVAAPGTNFDVGSNSSKGSSNGFVATLPPYGYLPVYAGPFNADHPVQMTITLSSGSATVGSFFVESVNKFQHLAASNVSTAASWSFQPAPVNGAYNYPGPNLQPSYPAGSLTSPSTMWVVIEQP